MSDQQESSANDAPVRGIQTATFLKSPADEELVAVPDTLCDPTFLESIPIDTWRSLLVTAGAEAHELNLEELASLLTKPVSALVADALATIGMADADSAIARLFDLEKQAGPALPEEWAWNSTAREQLARLWVLGQAGGELANRLAIVKATALPTSQPRKVFAGKAPRTHGWNKGKSDALTTHLRAQFAERGLGEYIDIVVTSRNERLVCYVVRSTRLRSMVRVNEEQTDRARFVYRKAVCDVLVYHGLTGRLELRVRGSALVDIYRCPRARSFRGPALLRRHRRLDVGSRAALGTEPLECPVS